MFSFFRTFFAQRNSIGTLDASLLNFKNLTVLNLSHNRLTKVQNLPASLRELNLSNNEIDDFEPLRQPLPLIHLGLAYNKISNATLAVIVKNFPKLFCLDLQFNNVCDLGSALN